MYTGYAEIDKKVMPYRGSYWCEDNIRIYLKDVGYINPVIESILVEKGKYKVKFKYEGPEGCVLKTIK